MKCLKASTLISLVASAGAMLAVSAPANAAVTGVLYKVVPASHCVYSSGATLKVSSYGNVYNSSTTATTTIVCPIEYDAVVSPDGLYGLTGVSVKANDKSTGGNISCQVNRITFSGGTQVAGTAAQTSGSTGGSVDLDLSLPATGSGNFVLKCTLPKKGGSAATITSYSLYADPGEPL